MRLGPVRQIQRVKTMQADRAEQAERARRLALEAAVQGVESARAELEAWRAALPGRIAAVYDAIIGQLVRVEAFDDCRAKVAELRARETLLAQRLEEAQAAAKQAAEALEQARRALAAARRAVSKFDELIAVLRRAEVAEAETREEGELEESAEVGHRAGRERAAETDDGDDGWADAA